MVSASYLFERFCWLTFTGHLFYVALTSPAYYGHLTYWTLSVHATYFAIDKSSPNARTAIYLLHGPSFSGAMGVFIGYAFISLGGIYRFGSWIQWENAIGQAAGTVTHERTLMECAVNKLYEHLWPVFALLIDARLSRDVLHDAYTHVRPVLTMLWGVFGYVAYALIWEQFSKRTKGELGTPLEVYVQPTEFKTSFILGKLGISANGLPEDFIFTNTQKLLLPSFALLMYRIYVSPMLNSTSAKRTSSVKQKRR